MKEWLDVLLDSLLDTLKMLPILLVVYLLIEFLEYKRVLKFEKSKFLQGKLSPIFGTLFGCVPQCGFSVISTDLYTAGKMSIGALIAVYVATSDEAVPIMISNPTRILDMIVLIGIKIVIGIVAGYAANLFYGIIFKKNPYNVQLVTQSKNVENSVNNEQKIEDHTHDENEHHSKGCCHHDVESKDKLNFVHPILHSLKIACFVLIANIIFGTIVMLIGEEKLTIFLESSKAFQPLVACLIGLIPNCVSSVILTELYLVGGISFGAVVAGLSVNAGLGLLILFKQNKKIKENIFIVLSLIVFSLIFGYAIHFINLAIL